MVPSLEKKMPNLARGHAQLTSPCVSTMSSIWAHSLARLSVCSLALPGVGVSLLTVTFDFCHATTLNPSPSVNELEDPSAIAGSVRLEYSQSACDGLMIQLCGGRCCSAHPGKWVVPLCWRIALISSHAF